MTAHDKAEFPRQFVAKDADLSQWPVCETCFRELLDRSIDSRETLERWILDVSELASCIDEQRARFYNASTCHTDNEAVQNAYLSFVEKVQAASLPWRHKLLVRLVALADQFSLPAKRYEVLLRNARNATALFRDENVPLLTADTKLANTYQRIVGAMMCEYDGREQTLQQMARYQEEPDRAVREETWRLSADRFALDRRQLDELYEKMVALRHRVARNASCADYREYMFKAMERFDYTPEDCLALHDSIEKIVVPAARKLADQRRAKLSGPTLRPWDFGVDPDGRPPLRPFSTVPELIAGAREVLGKVHPEIGRVFEALHERGLLDLDSRKGKAPGGYQDTYHERRVPFIFMNAAGTARDVETLLHEAGHACHTWACRNEPILAYRSCEGMIEFAEVASMGMECLTLPHLDVFFKDDTPRATHQFFERIVQFFPFMARIDAFQHYVYTHVDAGLEAWNDRWQALTRRFAPEVDYSGLEEYDRHSWQRKLHIYEVPFYYVEYGIAQLGALQVWLHSKRDYDQAVAFYRNGLALGGSRPLPELFEAAGCRFDFSPKTLRPLIEAVMEELDRT